MHSLASFFRLGKRGLLDVRRKAPRQTRPAHCLHLRMKIPQTKFAPTRDYILVLPVERKQSEVLAVISEEKYTQGIVIAAGPGKKNRKGFVHPLAVKPGDFVAYGDLDRGYDFYPTYIESGVIYRILQEADICFIAEPEDEAHGLPDAEIASLVANSRVLQIA